MINAYRKSLDRSAVCLWCDYATLHDLVVVLNLVDCLLTIVLYV